VPETFVEHHQLYPSDILVEGDIRDIPYPAHHFDFVFELSTIDHIHQKWVPLALDNICRVLKPAGKSVIATWIGQQGFHGPESPAAIGGQYHFDYSVFTGELKQRFSVDSEELLYTVDGNDFYLFTAHKEKRDGVVIYPVAAIDMDWMRELRNRFRHSFKYNQEIGEQQQKEWYQNYWQQPRDDYTVFAVWAGDDRIGLTSYRRWDSERYELGNNIIDTPFQGQGYFSQIYRAVKGRVGNAPMVATVLKDNTHMIDVYRHLGFRMAPYDVPNMVLMVERKYVS